jgi:cytochrome P450
MEGPSMSSCPQAARSAADVPYLQLSDPRFAMHSNEALKARADHWYARTSYGVAILRYEETAKLLKDRRLRQGSRAWPAKNGVMSGAFVDFWKTNIANHEGAEHSALRRVLNPAFTRRSADALIPRFRSLATELVESFIERGRCEFVSEFAEPYAARVLCILLDIAESDWESLARLSNRIGLSLGVTIREDIDEIDAAVSDLYSYADALIADRTRTPRDDVVTRLLKAEADGVLSREMLQGQIVNLIFAGMDTTRNQIGLALALFIDHPDQWELIAQDPSLARAAVEESMRIAPTVTWVTREAVEPFEFQGLDIPEGTVIHLLTGLSGTDDTDGAEVSLDITGTRRPHIGFGGGTHHCLGHFVARADMTVAIEVLAGRLTSVQRAPGGRWLPDSGNTGPVEFPVSFVARE